MEPNSIYWYGLSAFRKCLVLGSFVGGVQDGTEVNVSLSNGVYGGIVGNEFDNKAKTKEQEVRNLLTIATALDIANPPQIIDYLSLDVEGAEHMIMETFPFQKYKIRFATIERPNQTLRKLLTENGYTHANFTLSYWGETLWYHPNYVALSSANIEEIALSIKRVFPFK